MDPVGDSKKQMKSKNKGRKPSFWRLWRRFCLETTIQGLKYFYLYPDPVSRCVWALMTMFSWVMAYVLGLLLYTRFVDMPTRVTIEDQYAPVANLPYPAITMCTPNQMTLTNLAHFNRTLIDGDLNIDLYEVLPQMLGYYELVDDVNLTAFDQMEDLIVKNRHTIAHVMYSLAQPCDQFLRMCISGDTISDCKDFFRPIMTRHGLCCIFNSPYYFDKERNIRDPKFRPRLPDLGGLFSALTVAYDYNPAEALNYTLLNTGSTRISFNDWTEFPSDDETVMLYSPVEAFIIISGTHTYCSEEVASLPVHSRRCLFDHEISGQMTFPHTLYRNSDCDTMCFLKNMRNRCGCLPFYTPGRRSTEICNLSTIPCIVESRRNIGETYEEDCDCPRDCDSRQYKVETNLGDLKALKFLINSPYTMLKFNRSTSLFHFSFANAFYVKQKQETVMSLISFASNLGGVFGLCMGISALSVCEVLFFIYKLISIYFGKNYK